MERLISNKLVTFFKSIVTQELTAGAIIYDFLFRKTENFSETFLWDGEKRSIFLFKKKTPRT